eukprot:CAMPEP_0206448034 /NCGR_PEP_ID=MMETSP0324_2-20121206/17194_1 /ASSEMBLY_ACC=CAM_ASM_000836 /TAXON_ID=2866 /ORGANISM="Crypthecodinium cohnii, Strain Seligo" /LENGTH=493 /DNA_ID=CAMNT_0053917025 /DNA_START=125 /DNA_END=1606 /DNA_ORIENTATION=+
MAGSTTTSTEATPRQRPPLKKAKTGEAFVSELEKLEAQRSRKAASAAGEHSLTAAEKAFEEKVFRPTVSSSKIDPAVNFLASKKSYDESPLFALMSRMPKGAILHTHGIASGDFKALVEIVRSDGHFYVFTDEKPDLVMGSIRSFAEGATIPAGWVQARSKDEDELYSLLTLKPLPTVEECWYEFGRIWERVRGLACVAPFYFGRRGFLWDIFKRCYETKVMFLEIKEPIFAPWTEYDGTEIPDDKVAELFKETVDGFCAEHPGFRGARMVVTALKAQEPDDVRKAYQRGVELKKKFPNYISGFDMAGPEDLLKPIRAFAAVLAEEQHIASEQGIDFPFMIHAGETNKPEASQVYDAVALGCERIGHGFAIARHPALAEEVLARGISLECCPISNQVLGYFQNLATHDAIGLFRAGVPISISPDDPGMWHYSDVSYDFTAIAKAWHLSLVELKALVWNSILCSTLRGSEEDEALAVLEKDWNSWIAKELEAAA